ncbi:aminotransferase class I/II-fold pyridoxal phosphate-dependent enzyme [Sulfitobacter aestuariivivens]|uniref:Aminotransferase class I/II-fold pyridoxal phosphate-dependent enzyme n=1 Tax=Sulfitobacter aestuariivivens TaxID=2766981 RepID=A0A927D7P9_9RHOB|nr:aminotransferase class I/II-fold pyridoxal phosphate-dependent enzyme [Sulfitobacter aestuariivivens]MBD3665683.1 aminotransferase class I/II-fold pyridoxal phosphate-dependent enzyme [Sulfitobacter aestuariivivens]
MLYPDRFSNLPAHAWPRLRALLRDADWDGDVIQMTIGEPKHAFPAWVTDKIVEYSEGFNSYPPNDGSPKLKQSISDWIKRRYGVAMDPETEVMALNGTREGLYNAIVALSPETKNGQKPAVLMPNPFYQVYMIAAISGNADPIMVNATEATGHLPNFHDVPTDVLARTTAAYICSPANPQGAVAHYDYWASLIDLAETHDFMILADECYSEIYRDSPPIGVLEVVEKLGTDRNRVAVFHSLSKRSNLPGLRSGFIASGADTIREVKQLRNYAGAPLPLPLQQAAAAVWDDETHVQENRAMYLEKYQIADRILGNVPGYQSPEAGFFLWLPVDDDEAAAVKLWRETGVKVLPGGYLAQDVPGEENPGKTYIRVALVAPKDETARGLELIRDCLYPA